MLGWSRVSQDGSGKWIADTFMTFFLKPKWHEKRLPSSYNNTHQHHLILPYNVYTLLGFRPSKNEKKYSFHSTEDDHTLESTLGMSCVQVIYTYADFSLKVHYILPCLCLISKVSSSVSRRDARGRKTNRRWRELRMRTRVRMSSCFLDKMWSWGMSSLWTNLNHLPDRFVNSCMVISHRYTFEHTLTPVLAHIIISVDTSVPDSGTSPKSALKCGLERINVHPVGDVNTTVFKQVSCHSSTGWEYFLACASR